MFHLCEVLLDPALEICGYVDAAGPSVSLSSFTHLLLMVPGVSQRMVLLIQKIQLLWTQPKQSVLGLDE